MHSRAAYVSTVAACGFLLFLIEPLAGKRLLPLYGGSSSLWTASLLFFTMSVCLAYLYAYGLLKLDTRIQRRVHIALLASASLWAVVGAPLTVLGEYPALSVLLALASWVGPPFIALAASGPLLQRWYAGRFGEPYGLYAVSNGASLAGLLIYPFVLEPAVALGAMIAWWSVLIVVCFICVGVIAMRTDMPAESTTMRPLVSLSALKWVGYAAVPTLLLATVTAQITQVIAPIPLLWIVPLSLYLGSFILAFSGYGGGLVTTTLVLVSTVGAYVLTPATQPLLWLSVISYLSVLFFAATHIHARLYAARPPARDLAAYYVAIACGGALGTGIPTLLAPFIFDDYWEFPVAIALAALVAIMPVSGRRRPAAIRILGGLFVVVALTTFVMQDRLASVHEGVITRSRDFYGVATLSRTTGALALIHGRTLHGLQLADPALASQPTTYYTPASGIGRTFAFARSQRMHGASVGIIGLGTGSLAAYCTSGDSFTFYEIDPQIIRIATDDFNYLAKCAGSKVVAGDGRLSLLTSTSTFDIIAIDAFNSDSIPVHLLTREALQTYAAHLKGPASIVAFHVSNRYLDLVPAIIRLAADGRFASMVIRDDGTSGIVGVPTVWVLLAKDESVFRSRAFSGTDSLPPPPASRVWTDDYASVWPALYVPDLGSFIR